MRRHRLTTRNAVMASVLAEPENSDEYKFGRLARQNPQEIKDRAAAEWAAMDSEGKLPDGWEWKP